MEAFIVHDDQRDIIRIGMEIQKAGFTVKACRDQDRAANYVRDTKVDLLILKQVIDDRHTTGVALSAEWFNPDVVTILLSVRSREDVVEQFNLVPSINAILPDRPDIKLVGNLAQQVKREKSGSALILSPTDRSRPFVPRKVA